jgi:hypothetical protein
MKVKFVSLCAKKKTETLCWNRKHVLSNLRSLTGVYSRFSSCQRRVAVTFGCA